MKNQTFDFTELFSQSYFVFSLNLYAICLPIYH